MSHIDDLPPLRQVIEKYDLAARKSLGQNFLLDLNLTMKIARAAGSLENCCVLEIGPGPGGLTRALLASGAKHVVAIERDPRCLPALHEISQVYPGRLTVMEGDALQVDHRHAIEQAGIDLADTPVRIAANLPYNIATPLLTGWIACEKWPPFWLSMTLMFQKEVAERIVATEGDRAWGRLGVLTDWRCQAAIAFDLPPQAFTPPPKVTSSVVMAQPRDTPLPADLKAVEQITRSAFGQRRKMLRQSLKSLGGATLLEAAEIDGTARAEQLDTAAFVRLANVLASNRS